MMIMVVMPMVIVVMLIVVIGIMIIMMMMTFKSASLDFLQKTLCTACLEITVRVGWALNTSD